MRCPHRITGHAPQALVILEGELPFVRRQLFRPLAVDDPVQLPDDTNDKGYPIPRVKAESQTSIGGQD